MPLLEIFNSLLVTFVLTEVIIRERKPHDLKPYFVLFVAPNILLSEWLPLHFFVPLRLFIVLAHFVGSPFVYASSHLGSSVILVTFIFLSVVAVDRSHKKTLTPKTIGLLAGGLLALWIIFVFVGLDELLHHTEALKVIAVAFLFTLMCFVDARRFRSDITESDFFAALLSSLLWLLPGFPFAAVLISTAFLVLVSFVQFIGLDPHFLNGAIYYGTLYGPFYFAYQETKRKLVGKSAVLPTGGAETPESKEGGLLSLAAGLFERTRARVSSLLFGTKEDPEPIGSREQ